MPRLDDAKIGPANSVHASACDNKYNEIFDLTYENIKIN